MDSKTVMLLLNGLVETVYMTLVSTALGYLIGLPIGILLTVTDKEGIHPNALVYRIMDVIINIMRSIPFLILLILLIPFTRFLVERATEPRPPSFRWWCRQRPISRVWWSPP